MFVHKSPPLSSLKKGIQRLFKSPSFLTRSILPHFISFSNQFIRKFFVPFEVSYYILLIMIGIYLAIWNSWTFILFGIDKYKACHHRFRISENTLLIHAFLGGAVGGFLGMLVFRHKTRHLKFCLIMPLLVLIQVFFLCFFLK